MFIKLWMIGKHAAIRIQILRWWSGPPRRYLDLFFHRHLLPNDLLPAHIVTDLDETGPIGSSPVEPANAIEHLLGFLVVIFDERLYLVFEPLAEVVEVFVGHELLAGRPPLRVQAEAFPRKRN